MDSGLSSLVEQGAGRIDEAGSLIERLLASWNKGVATTGDMFRKDSVLREGSVLNDMMESLSAAYRSSVYGDGGGDSNDNNGDIGNDGNDGEATRNEGRGAKGEEEEEVM
jgi:hypothetical protein